MAERFKKGKCVKCGKFFIFLGKMMRNKKGYICMDCGDEGESLK